MIAGVVVSAMMLISMPLHESGVLNTDNGMIVGYATMVIALSTIFFGIKTYRDQYENGTISFWRAFKVGILIAVLASIMYAITWDIYFRFKGDAFIEYYASSMIEKLEHEGASEAKIREAKAQMEQWGEAYQNPIIRFAFTLVEILPVGILITLICAALLRKRKFLPA